MSEKNEGGRRGRPDYIEEGDVNADWIKFSNPLASLNEILIYEVMKRFPEEAGQDAFFRRMDGLTVEEKENFIESTLVGWGVELPYWWEMIKERRKKDR